MVSCGCIESDAQIAHSMVFTVVHCHSYAHLDQVVDVPYCDIGRGARLRNVVLDRGVTVPEKLVIGEDTALDRQRFRVTEAGVALVTQPMIDRLER